MYLGEASGLPLGQATRDAFGEALKELGASNKLLCTVDGDVGNACLFRNLYYRPDTLSSTGIVQPDR